MTDWAAQAALMAGADALRDAAVTIIAAREAIPPMLDADRLGDGTVPAVTTLDEPA